MEIGSLNQKNYFDIRTMTPELEGRIAFVSSDATL